MLNPSRYESYKESEVPDLGEIPAHWKVIRNRFLFREQNERSLDGRETHLCMSQKFGLVPSDDFEDKTLQSESYEGGRLCLKGDLVLNRLKAHLSVFSTAPCEGLVSPDYSVFRLRDSKMIPKYFEHLFKTPVYLSEFNRRVRGIVVGFYRLYSGDFNDVRAICPPIEDQQRIVEFLDHKTSEIDQAIAKKQRLIELLQEQKAILINQAVTKGLNPNLPMCDSGIEWLSEVPEHWTIGKLKFFLQSVDYGLSESALSEGNYKYLNMGHIQDRKVLVENTGYLNSVPECLLLENNDILFNRTNSFDLVGKSGIFKGERIDRVTFASYLVRLRPVKGVVPDWLNFILNDVSFLSYIRSLALRSLHQANLNPNRLSAIHVPVPPVEEQRKIADFLSVMEKKMNEQIATAQRTIELYEQLKKTYISEAVTGKIKV